MENGSKGRIFGKIYTMWKDRRSNVFQEILTAILSLPIVPSRIISGTNGYFLLLDYVDGLDSDSAYYNYPGSQVDRATGVSIEKGKEHSAGLTLATRKPSLEVT